MSCNSGPNASSLSLPALRRGPFRGVSHLNKKAAQGHSLAAVPLAREALGGVLEDHAPAPPEVERRFP